MIRSFFDLVDKISKYPFFKYADAIIAIDARGFIIECYCQSSKETTCYEGKNKLPGLLIESNYGLEYGKDILSIQESAIEKFKKFVIVDDLLATGGTAKCVYDMLKIKERNFSFNCCY